AMLRQPHSDRAVPFTDHRIGRDGGTVGAAAYDLGRAGVAWSDVYDQDTDGPGERIPWWNTGRTWRNDGMDIALEADGTPVVAESQAGEWLRYTLTVEGDGARPVTVVGGGGGRASVSVNGGDAVAVQIPAGEGWRETEAGVLLFM